MLTQIKVSVLLTNILIGFLSFHAPVLAQNKRFDCPNPNGTLENLVSRIDKNAIVCRLKNSTIFGSDVIDFLTLYRQDEQGKLTSLVNITFFNFGARTVLLADNVLSNVKEPYVGFLLNQRTFLKWLTPPNPALVDKFSPDLKLILDIVDQPKQPLTVQ
ncbi:MAG: hypothetical protein KME22_13470 [Hassallia sp. WJT32-NPBG1]|jgi:hypothetical protein|nr:hypothetical protein [Hassallia sp. WJT32-NPBG1]